MQKKYGDDFQTGDVFVTQGITVTETHLVNWSGLTGDYYPLHVDREYAAKTQFGERLAHGPLIYALAVGLISLSGYGGDAAIAWIGTDNMRMLSPVRIGDTVHVETEVIDRQPTKDPKRGIQVWRYTVKNQRAESVMVFDFKLMFHMRG